MASKKKPVRPTLDLHRIRHAMAPPLVENFVLLSTPPLRIITGKSDTMQDLVMQVLDSCQCAYSREPGSIFVTHFIN